MVCKIAIVSSSRPGKTVSTCRQVNVLAICTGANHEYTLSEPTAMANSIDRLYLDTFPPMNIALPESRRLLNT